MNTINANYLELANSILLQAVRDYFKFESSKPRILKELRSPWMDFISNGKSIFVAEQLEKNPDGIASRIKSESEEI